MLAAAVARPARPSAARLAQAPSPTTWAPVCAGFGVLATLHFHWYLMFFLTNTTLALALAPASRSA